MKSAPSTKKVAKSDCSGCKDNFYNGNNGLGVKECWMFKNATMVRKMDIHVDQRPPYDAKRTTLRPSCYKANRMVRVDPAALDSKGFWQS